MSVMSQKVIRATYVNKDVARLYASSELGRDARVGAAKPADLGLLCFAELGEQLWVLLLERRRELLVVGEELRDRRHLVRALRLLC